MRRPVGISRPGGKIALDVIALIVCYRPSLCRVSDGLMNDARQTPSCQVMSATYRTGASRVPGGRRGETSSLFIPRNPEDSTGNFRTVH